MYPVALAKWKCHFLKHGVKVFEEVKAYENRVSELERMLGEKEVEIALLKVFCGRADLVLVEKHCEKYGLKPVSSGSSGVQGIWNCHQKEPKVSYRDEELKANVL